MAHRVLAVLRDNERSVSWLARQIGYSVSFTWRVLNGERGASAEFKERVARALDKPVADLFDEGS